MTPSTADDKARPLSKIKYSCGNYLVSWIPYNHENYISPRLAVVHWSEEAAQETVSALKRHHKRWNGDYQDLKIQKMDTYPNTLTNVPIVEPAKNPAKVLAPLAGEMFNALSTVAKVQQQHESNSTKVAKCEEIVDAVLAKATEKLSS